MYTDGQPASTNAQVLALGVAGGTTLNHARLQVVDPRSAGTGQRTASGDTATVARALDQPHVMPSAAPARMSDSRWRLPPAVCVRRAVSAAGSPRSVLYTGAMPNRSGDWLRQAERDLEQAEESRRSGRHEWACFAAHQAAEKAVKAAHLHAGQEAWGQVIARLLAELPPAFGVSAGLIDRARVLDNFYIPTRYADAHPAGAPFEHYGPLQTDEALRHARAVLDFIRHALARR